AGRLQHQGCDRRAGRCGPHLSLARLPMGAGTALVGARPPDMSDTARSDLDPRTALEACLAALADNRPADAVLQRLRAIEPALPEDVVARARFLRARAIATNRLGFGGEAL